MNPLAESLLRDMRTFEYPVDQGVEPPQITLWPLVTSRHHLMEQFHQAMGQDIDTYLPGEELLMLRLRLIREEYEEVREEFLRTGGIDREKLTKELCDLLYVIYGAGTALGLDLEFGFEVVHASNMSKLDDDGNPIIDNGGKVMKGPNYVEPDMARAANTALEHVD